MKPAVRAVAALAALAFATPTAIDVASAAPKPRCPVGQVRQNGQCVAYGVAAPTTTTTTAPAPAEQIGEYKFLFTLDDGTVIRWDPCTALRYVVNYQGAPSFAAEILAGAIADVENATGIDFVDGGTTGRGRDGTVPDGADAIIAFTTPGESGGLLPSSAAGVGGANWLFPGDAPARLVDGLVLINASDMAGYTSRYGEQFGRDVLRTVLLHELGHMVGLDHVNDVRQVMYPVSEALFYGSGDREGLRLLGRSQGCVPHGSGGFSQPVGGASGGSPEPTGDPRIMVCQLHPERWSRAVATPTTRAGT